MAGITVGFGGSPSAQRALEWAMSEAALRHVPLTVLTVHPTGQRLDRQPHHPLRGRARGRKARQAAEDAVATATAGLGSPALPRSLCGGERGAL